jgi:hypothetical protein
MRSSICQTAIDLDQTAFETFVQQDSDDVYGTALEKSFTTFKIGGWLQSQSSLLQDISKSSIDQSCLVSQRSSIL